MEALSERLRTKATRIHVSFPTISRGSDAAIMVDADDEIDALKARIAVLEDALREIARIPAAAFARRALEERS